MIRSVCGCLAIIAGTALAGPELASPLTVDPAGSTDVMTALNLDEAGLAALRGMGSVTLTDFVLNAGASVDLQLVRRDVYSSDARVVSVTADGEVERVRPDVTMYGGHVAGEDDSTVFLAFSAFGVEGFIESQGQTWIVSSGPLTQDLPTAIYNLTTLPEGVINWAQWECAADQLGEHVQPIGGGEGVSRGSGCFLLEYAVETDQEFLGLFGGNEAAANTYIATLFGAVNEIYSRDFQAEVQVVWSRLWTTTDPWTQGDSVNQLFEYRDYWEANMTAVHKDLGHYLSGRGLGGGVAWLPGICNDGYNYGLSGNLSGFFPYPLQDNHAQNWDIMVVSHEGGHNVGAPHTHEQSPLPNIDECGNGNCAVAPHGTIMSYCHLCSGGMTNVELHFHPQNINSWILPTLSGGTCDIVGNCDNITFAFPNGLPTLVSPEGTTTIEVVATPHGSIAVAAGTGMLHYDTGSGSGSVAMSESSPGVYVATIPASNCLSTVTYSFSADGTDGLTYTDPGTGSYEATSAAGVLISFADDAEVDLGWATSNTATDGQWGRGVPINCGRGDPTSDYDGSGQCFLTDNSAANSCNSDVDNGTVTLTSPVLDATMPEAHLSYARWFSNSQGGAPFEDTFTVEVSNDGGSTWTNLETVGPNDGEVSGGWFYKTFRIADTFATPSNQFRVRFIAADTGSGSLVEAGVDAIQVFAYDCGEPSCDPDRNGDGLLDFFDVQDFLNDYSAHDPSADMNNDGAWDFFDVQAYLGIFSDGCP